MQMTSSYGVLIIEGNSTATPYGFASPVTTKVLDTQSGTWYVGITNGTSPANSGTFALSKVLRPTFQVKPQFTGIATNAAVQNQTIELLNLAPQPQTSPILTFVIENGTLENAQQISASSSDGTVYQASATLFDTTGAATSGIVAMASSSSFVFAAIRPTGGAAFGAPDGGIALVEIVTTNNVLSSLVTKDATTGLNGNLPVELQAASTVVKGGGPDAVTFLNTTTHPIVMYYDAPLGRVYLGAELESGPSINDIAKAVVAGRLSSSNALILDAIAPDSAITPAANDEIVVTKGSSLSVTVQSLRVMHATTGPSYLIICGGNGMLDQVGNLVQALPLVDNPTNQAVNGTLAQASSALVNFKFVTPATAPGDLPVTTSSPSFVGANPLPIQANQTISDMVVVGDTVYVAIAQPPSSTNDTGVFYSQAEFDNTGKIIRWTPWTKRAVPFNAFPNTLLPGSVPHNGAISFMDVDAATGNIYIVDGTTDQVAGITQWSNGAIPAGLIQQVSKALTLGCFSVLDLDQATRGFLGATVDRYALFGGTGLITFALVSESNGTISLSAPQTVTEDYTTAQNFLVTLCPGCVQTLEYSRRLNTEGNQNYFFAGTDKGLFVFADSAGNGFNVNSLSTLDVAPFATRFWQQISAIPGSIIDIKTSGNGGTVYIIASQSTLLQPFNYTLYSVPFTTNTNTMFAPGNIQIIAQTGVGSFGQVLQFLGMQILATDNPAGGNPADKEQLVLATNQGLYLSAASQTGLQGIASATNQTTAQWQLLPTTANTLFEGVAGMDVPIRDTVWPFSLQDQFGFGTFERSSIYQLNGVGNSTGTAALVNFVPTQFNALGSPPGFATFNPITYFFSDGTRRFFLVSRLQDRSGMNNIMVSPYNVAQWNLTTPTLLSFPIVNQVNNFWWVKEIGVTGLLLAGTNTGIIGLE